TELLGSEPHEGDLLRRGGKLLAQLVSHDDWLAEEFTVPDANRYQQFLLHADPQQRFSVVSFVWGPGQRTPIHDHRVWGLIGMLRGAEDAQGYRRNAQGRLETSGPAIRLQPGQVEALSPHSNDVHQVSNAFSDQVSISIHVYGADIGTVKRAVYDLDGSEKLFISGYSNAATAHQDQPTGSPTP
ncbi:cysteine dioxygenase, partial [Pseudomonas syringae]|nr:cysteine dioxygenase [Pseudomonas syringae]